MDGWSEKQTPSTAQSAPAPITDKTKRPRISLGACGRGVPGRAPPAEGCGSRITARRTSRTTVQQLLRALADPARLEMVHRLAVCPAEEAPCSDLYTGVSKSTATHHFKILVEAGVLHPVMVGAYRGHRLRREALHRAAPGLLDALTEALAREG
ncbi:ArsR/SmtB family transcription factor [Streptomyces olivaceus]|uniref:ArsR/SmtB family transcription factor n=1 Tax=Streptomyces TaxID=1883 RepID=UPI001FB75642|nr:helix-turn-helix transcriptional regulator [Streptomyces sp. CB09030]UOG81560.1 ArsR family transcriptional regulator [Streptomyces sp. CB09030]